MNKQVAFWEEIHTGIVEQGMVSHETIKDIRTELDTHNFSDPFQERFINALTIPRSKDTLARIDRIKRKVFPYCGYPLIEF